MGEGPVLLRIDTCWAVASGMGAADVLRSTEFQVRHLLLSLRAGDPYRVSLALSLEGLFLRRLCVPRGRLVTERALALAEQVGHPHAIAISMFAAGAGALLNGEWRSADDLLQRTEIILRERCAGVAWELEGRLLPRSPSPSPSQSESGPVRII